MLRVAEHRAVLDRILRDSGLSADALELVPDVHEWCRANGVEESNPFRQGKCVRRISDQSWPVVMVDTLTDAMISSGKAAMVAHGFLCEVSTLDSDEKYLVHLMLHEVSCHVLQTIEQEPRDRWAFERLPTYAI